jgi:hypothetical protein
VAVSKKNDRAYWFSGSVSGSEVPVKNWATRCSNDSCDVVIWARVNSSLGDDHV